LSGDGQAEKNWKSDDFASNIHLYYTNY
jgi:hypothetical protein